MIVRSKQDQDFAPSLKREMCVCESESALKLSSTDYLPSSYNVRAKWLGRKEQERAVCVLRSESNPASKSGSRNDLGRGN